MSFRIIRCGSQCCLVIAVSPPEAKPETPEAKFYRYANWQIEDDQLGVFNEISRDTTLGYFSGQADGLGWGERPDYEFESLTAIVNWITTVINRTCITEC